MTELKTRHIDSLESLRGIAALMVLLYHLVALVKIPLPDSFGFISTHFGLGVPLFYTLSGFVLAYGYGDKLKSPAQIQHFYIRRLFRIAPLFYVMLILWLIANWVIWSKTFSARVLFLNFTFLFGLVPGQHESVVWAGWSIGVEMLFYLIFPVLTVLVPSLRSAVIGFITSCILSISIYKALSDANLGNYAYMNLGNHLPFFMAGIVSFRLWQTMKFSKLPALGWGLLLAAITLIIAISTSDKIHMRLAHYGFDRNIWSIVFGMVLLSACFARNPLLESAPLRKLGQLSFGIYLIHPMTMAALIKLGFPAYISSMFNNTMAGFIFAAVVTISLVAILSNLSFRFVENPGIELGRNLARSYRGDVVPA